MLPFMVNKDVYLEFKAGAGSLRKEVPKKLKPFC